MEKQNLKISKIIRIFVVVVMAIVIMPSVSTSAEERIDNRLENHPFYSFNMENRTIEGIYENLPLKNFKEDFNSDFTIRVYQNNIEVDDNAIFLKGMEVSVKTENDDYGIFKVNNLLPSYRSGRANSWGFSSPLPSLSPSAITSGYGWRYLDGYGYNFHRGIDFGKPANTSIRATKGGTVVYSGYAVSGSNDDGEDIWLELIMGEEFKLYIAI